MNRLYTTVCSLLLLISVALPLQAQDLNVYMAASSEVVGPGDRTTFTLTATNTSTDELTSVSFEVQLPDHINNFNEPPGLNCSSSCNANETAPWTVGTLNPGQSQTLFYRVQIADDAPEGAVTSTVTATTPTEASDSLAIQIDDSPLVTLSLAPDPSPVVAGEKFTYTLTYSNTGTTTASNTVLRMPIPEGASFDSATHDGTESGDTVTWELGTLGTGAGGQVQMTVTLAESLDNDRVLKGVAELDPNIDTEPVARSSTVSPVRSEGPLHMQYAVSQTALGPDDALDLILTASNTGTVDLTDVEARVLLPGFIDSFIEPPGLNCRSSCNANEAAPWTIGTLAPGQSRTIFFRTSVASDAPQGEILRSMLTASSSNTGQVSAAVDMHIDPSPLLRLSLAPDPGPAIAGEEFTYTLTAGYVGSNPNSPSDVMLSMPLPEGASFVSATADGELKDGVVDWEISTMGSGHSREFRLTVRPDASLPEGSFLTARAELDPQVSNESLVRSTAITPVRSEGPLHVQYAVSQTALGPDDALDLILTASNTGAVDLTDVEARVLLPGFIDSFIEPPGLNCRSSCNANEAAPWTIGTLAPGQSRTIFFRTSVASDAPQGEILRSMLTASSSNAGQVSATQDLAVDPSPLLRLSLAPDPGPAIAGEEFTYILSVGNITSEDPSDVVLSMPLPEGTSFVSATDFGSLQEGDVVVWTLGNVLSNSRVGQAELVVMVEPSLTDGNILEARAELDPNNLNEVTVRSSTVTSVQSDEPPLRIDYEYALSDSTALPDSQFTHTLIATNTSTVDQNEVEVRVLLPSFIDSFIEPPGLNCRSSCNANEVAPWSIGTLAPGQSDTLTFEPTVSSDVSLGNVTRSLVTAASGGSNEAVAQHDLTIGNYVDPLPVELAAFTSAIDGTAVLLQWKTASETGNAGFEVQHRRTDEGKASKRAWKNLAFLPSKASNGTSSEVLSYSYRAEDLKFGQHAFRLLQKDTDGTESFSEVHEVEISLAEAFALSEAAPNPFRNRAAMTLVLQETQEVRAEVYDVLGRRVAVLHDGPMPAGQTHTLQLEAGALASGLYLLRVTGEHFAPQTRQVMLVK